MNRTTALAMAGTFLLAASPAPAPNVLSIAPAETVTARVSDDSSGFVELSRGPTSAASQSDLAPDTIRFVFTADGNKRMLTIRNGYTKALHFKAVMVRGKRSAPTSICTVLPNIASFEMWPQPLDRIELSAPTLTAGGQISCS